MKRVIDGDTFDCVRTDGERERVRLVGLDAPELGHGESRRECHARTATRGLTLLVDGRTVRLTSDPAQDQTDRYGRRLAFVSAPSGRIDDVGARMLRQGHAKTTTHSPTRQKTYRAAQAAAKQERAGMWRYC